jgi:hypothetical protein
VTLPWRLLWSNEHERVLLEGERAYILVETEAELVIYRPGPGTASRYPKDGRLMLERLGTIGYLFETPGGFESARAGGSAREGQP